MQIVVKGLPLPKGSGSRKLVPAQCPWCSNRLPPRIGMLGPFMESANAKTKSRGSGGLKRWARMITEVARIGKPTPIESAPVGLYIRFCMPRPKSVKRKLPSVKPDLSKLVRAVEDALIGVAFKDDSQITHLDVRKEYAELPADVGAVIVWKELG